jgi:hypothetical protein
MKQIKEADFFVNDLNWKSNKRYQQIWSRNLLLMTNLVKTVNYEAKKYKLNIKMTNFNTELNSHH